MITILMVTYNREQLLERALCSIVNQTNQDFKVVIINNGGQRPHKLLRKLRQDNRIQWINIDKTTLAGARNEGLKLITTSHVAYLDDDDVYLPNHIDVFTQHFQDHKDCTLAYTQCEWIQEEANRIFNLTGRPFDRKLFLINNYIPVISIAHRTDIFPQFQFDSDLQYHEDWELWGRLAQRYDFCYIPETTARYCFRQDNMCRIKYKEMIAHEKAIRKHLNNYASLIIERK